MPYKSNAQRKFFHSEGAKKAGITESEIKKYDKETKGMKLKEHNCPSCKKGITHSHKMSH